MSQIPNQRLLEEFIEFVDGQAGLPDNSPKRAAVRFSMVWNNQLRKWFLSAKDHVTTLLSSKQKTISLQGFCAFSSGDPRQVAHTATRRASNRSAGTGK